MKELLNFIEQNRQERRNSMKAPDKLYLHPNHKDKVGANWLTFPLTNEDECYIRKNALMEWAKARKAELTSSAPFVAGERKVIKEVINKIESL